MVSELPRTQLWVGGLPDNTDEDSFRCLFMDCGEIVSMRVVPDKSYGFVTFALPDDAAAVVHTFDGFELGNGRRLSVKFHEPKGTRFARAEEELATKSGGKGGKASGKGGSNGFRSSPYPTNFQTAPHASAPIDPNLKKTETICRMFAITGKCSIGDACSSPHISAAMPGVDQKKLGQAHRVQLAPSTGQARPVELPTSVAHMKGGQPVEQVKAFSEQSIKVTNYKPPPCRNFEDTGYVDGGDSGSFEHGAEDLWEQDEDEAFGVGAEPQSELYGACAHSQEEIFTGRSSDYSNGGEQSNLYVKGLPPHTDELYLYKLFAPYGSVLCVLCKNSRTGPIGVVTYNTDEEASFAIQRVNGRTTVDGYQLGCSLQAK